MPEAPAAAQRPTASATPTAAAAPVRPEYECDASPRLDELERELSARVEGSGPCVSAAAGLTAARQVPLVLILGPGGALSTRLPESDAMTSAVVGCLFADASRRQRAAAADREWLSVMLELSPGAPAAFWKPEPIEQPAPPAPPAADAPASAASTEATPVSGRLPPEFIRAVVRAHYGEMSRCYEQGLLADPMLEGRVTLRFAIERDGHVGMAAALTDMPTCGVAECTRHVLRQMVFPRPEGGIVTVQYPIQFQPAPE